MSSTAGPEIKPTRIADITLNAAGGQPDSGSSPLTFDGTAKTFNIVKNYRWTASDVSENDEIPHVVLYEHRNLESNIMRMIKFYTGINVDNNAGSLDQIIEGLKQGGEQTIGHIQNILPGIEQTPKDILDPYEEIFPDSPTSLKYIFPYFTKEYMKLQSAEWAMVDKISKTAGEAATGSSKVLGAFSEKAGELVGGLQSAMSFVTSIGETALKLQYPLVGANDRPRVFASHSERSITIDFPLYNTLHESDWKKNRLFLQVMMSQNLFIKRDFMTGLPPVFYRVLVPGQYFSFASSVTNIDVQNLGNVRMMYEDNQTGPGKGIIVPDAWQVSITLTELTMPSLNQYQAAITPVAYNRVVVTKP